MPQSDTAGRLSVTLPDGRVLRFSGPFLIGRDASCEVQVVAAPVSRRHAEVVPSRGGWVVRDLQSSNGLFVDGERVDSAPITMRAAVTLGESGPTVLIEPETVVRQTAMPSAPAPPPSGGESLDEYAQRYFQADGDEESVGDRTLMIRKAFRRVQEQQKRRQQILIGAAVVLVVAIGAYAYREHRRAAELEVAAEATFYNMKQVDVIVAGLQQQVNPAANTPAATQIRDYLAQRREMEASYETYAAKLYDRNLNEKDRLILRVTRMFGECELAAPPDYIREVKRYIQMWQSTGRFTRALKLANDLGYTRRIASAFTAQGLPPQYFYLAMQESSFDVFAVGPGTRWGIAKGMWQFIPETGAKYGLRIGPLASIGRPDPADDRFNWEKATDAAAKYIKDIYATDAQASGLLVMASYNWGEHRIIDILRRMPQDPRQRNFWQLLAKHQVPDQTYDYVFNIVSAAVIGENPRLFGFQFDNPLAFAEQH
jgi:hypothetical protein